MIKAIIFDWRLTLVDEDRKLFPYSKKVLNELQSKYKLAVISRARTDNIETRLKQIGEIGHYFNVIAADKEKTREQYLECIERLGVKPENTLIVDDRAFLGIKIGNQLGCQTAWINQGAYADELPNEETGKPTHIINSIEDLLEIL